MEPQTLVEKRSVEELASDAEAIEDAYRSVTATEEPWVKPPAKEAPYGNDEFPY